MRQQTTPQATTRQSPCALFLGWQVLTRLDLLRLELASHVEGRQAVQKEQHDHHAHARSIEVGQPVMVKNMRPGDLWIPGVVMRLLGPLTYLVDVGEGRAWKRHIDHLKIRELGPVQEIPIVPDEGIIPHGLSPGETGSPIPVEVTDGSTEEVTAPDQSRPEPQLETLIEATRPNVSTPLQLPSPPSPAPVRQYPTRLRRPPDTCDWFMCVDIHFSKRGV